MKYILIALIGLGMSSQVLAQGKYFTRDGHIKFFSSTPMEDIEADNRKVTIVLDEETGKLEISAVMKSFEFEKALMEEHFNENYVESKDFPKATFKGEIKGFNTDNYSSKAEAIAVGKMTIHGVTKEVEIPGTLEMKDGSYHMMSKFMISPEDYDVEIPNTVRDNIAKEMEVTVDATLGALKK